MPEIYSIGHGTRPKEEFLGLLHKYVITCLADIRSVPYSRFNPQYNTKAMRAYLEEAGISYIHLENLGGRPKDTSLYSNGRPDYNLIEKQPFFHEGISALLDLAGKYLVCIMCSERKPEDCHRTKLVGRYLEKIGVTMKHIDEEGRVWGEGKLL
jgi:uncharacterized protein (DUF488 family)